MRFTMVDHGSRRAGTPLLKTSLAIAGAVALIAGCRDLAEPTKGPPAISARSTNSEQAALFQLAQAVSMTIGNSTVRKQLHDDLRASRYTHEHKLSFTSYLSSGEGSAMAAAMSSAAGIKRDSLSALLRAVRPLELYLPVAAHRATWTGDADMIVAAQLHKTDSIVGFDAKGIAMALSIAAPPSKTTLSLVPVETDFSKTLDVGQYVNINDAGGAAIGTYVDRRSLQGGQLHTLTTTPPGCPPAPQSMPGKIRKECTTVGYPADPTFLGLPSTKGLFMQAMRIWDNAEPWPRGDPEIEIYILGTQQGHYSYIPPQSPPGTPGLPTPPIPPQFPPPPVGPGLPGAPGTPIPAPPPRPGTLPPGVTFDPTPVYGWIGCSGAKAPTDPGNLRVFDFNGQYGATYSQNVLILEQRNLQRVDSINDGHGTVLERRLSAFGPPFMIRVVERDDGQECPFPPKEGADFSIGVTLRPLPYYPIWKAAQKAIEFFQNFVINNDNDIMGTWTFQSWTEIQSLNKRKLSSSYLDMWITDSGLNQFTPPITQDPWTGNAF